MKKLLSLTLAVIMILSLCACGGSGNETPSEPEAPKLELGFGKVKGGFIPLLEIMLRLLEKTDVFIVEKKQKARHTDTSEKYQY